jgi:iron complex transport system ATP-binding protein
MLEAKDITIRYEDRTAVDGVSFSLPAGQILAIVGANGAGKSSMLKSVNASVSYSGSIDLDGAELKTLSRREIAKRIAVVAQENETRFPVTVLEFVLAGRFAHGGGFGWETEADIEFARNAIRECDLTEFESRIMNNLSGGERQRVVLARALATGARLLLLDEPTANLDLGQQARLLRLVRDKCSNKGYSAVVVTHDLNLAAAFADQIVALNSGTVVVQGTPRNVLTAANVKKFLGVDVIVDEHPAGGMRIATVYYGRENHLR